MEATRSEDYPAEEAQPPVSEQFADFAEMQLRCAKLREESERLSQQLTELTREIRRMQHSRPPQITPQDRLLKLPRAD